MDRTDVRILELLQKNGDLPVQEIADAVNLSVAPCWRRIQKLKEDGVIRCNVALLDPAKVNLGLTVFIAVKTNQHNVRWTENFTNTVRSLPEVVEFHRMAGDLDYLLKVMVPDLEGYNSFYKRLIRSVDLMDVSASFSMEPIKVTTELPLDAAGNF